MIPEMDAFKDYDDWLDFRAGTFFGLEIAGLTVELVAVDLKMFTKWRKRRRPNQAYPRLINSPALSNSRLIASNKNRKESDCYLIFARGRWVLLSVPGVVDPD